MGVKVTVDQVVGSSPTHTTKINNMRFEKYKQNLKQEGNYIVSYDTKVAEIIDGKLHKLDWKVGNKTSSPTTSKHINYAASELGLEITN